MPEPGDLVENEPICYDDYEDISNIGCSAGIWDTIPANCNFYGTSGDYMADSTFKKDEDWLEVEIEDFSDMRLRAFAEFEGELSIIRQGVPDPCESYAQVFIDTIPACDSIVVWDLIPEGKYWIKITPASLSGVPCGSEYQLSLIVWEYTNCFYVGGDVNCNGIFNGIDIVFGVNYFKGGMLPPCSCMCNSRTWYVSGDLNGDCNFNGLDISYMVGYFKGFWPAHWCPDCPPGSAGD
jgi:hypothetical protein